MELTVRFIGGTHQIEGKDAMARHIIGELDRAGIGMSPSHGRHGRVQGACETGDAADPSS